MPANQPDGTVCQIPSKTDCFWIVIESDFIIIYLVISSNIAIPLNRIEMQPGTYQIVVNGVEQSFNWTGTARD
jgi:hypothetical protein